MPEAVVEGKGRGGHRDCIERFGNADGDALGLDDGDALGLALGDALGLVLGLPLGLALGDADGEIVATDTSPTGMADNLTFQAWAGLV